MSNEELEMSNYDMFLARLSDSTSGMPGYHNYKLFITNY